MMLNVTSMKEIMKDFFKKWIINTWNLSPWSRNYVSHKGICETGCNIHKIKKDRKGPFIILFILCRIGPAFYLPKPLQRGRMQIIRQKQNLHHPNYKFFWQEGRVKGKG